MSAISAPRLFVEPRTLQTSSGHVHDVTDCVKSWGRRGIFFGANFGLVLGAIFVAIPFSTDVLTFGVIGTLLVGSVECAVLAGGFAALAAALYGEGVRSHSSSVQFGRILTAGRSSAVAGLPDVPLAEWPRRGAYPVQTAVLPLMQAPDEDFSALI